MTGEADPEGIDDLDPVMDIHGGLFLACAGGSLSVDEVSRPAQSRGSVVDRNLFE